jgi:hypothetical protein
VPANARRMIKAHCILTRITYPNQRIQLSTWIWSREHEYTPTNPPPLPPHRYEIQPPPSKPAHIQTTTKPAKKNRPPIMGFQPNGGAAMALAALATSVSLVISGLAIYKHLAHYSIPRCVWVCGWVGVARSERGRGRLCVWLGGRNLLVDWLGPIDRSIERSNGGGVAHHITHHNHTHIYTCTCTHSIQRYIVRILFVAPVYALGSMLSLRFPNAR